MADPAFVVVGKGNLDSLCSASHGAGRKMSRSQAKQHLDQAAALEYLEARGVKLLSAGVDELPAAYKDIVQVMSEQTDLVDTLARFDPQIVRMAGTMKLEK
jgi:tRNA-splicing ligase RtcB